jgi:Kef-type K+ transport system membrane component KefB
VTGVLFPIALSFLLIPITSTWIPIGRLTAFAAGASLASTSLGTTYAVLLATDLTRTRVGTILATAAMLDDVVGLVMFKVISSLAKSVNAQAVIRPIAVSVGFLLLALLATQPLKRFIIPRIKSIKLPFIDIEASGFVFTGVTIMGLIAAAGYAGTSVLFVGYLTGVCASYLFHDEALRCYEMYTLY